MSKIATCIPRTVPADQRIEAARVATEINPMNQPAVEGQNLSEDSLALMTSKYWGSGGVRLSVGFLDGPEAALRTKIVSHMNAWAKTANVTFTETDTPNDGDVRIFRETTGDPDWDGYWSYMGTDIRNNAGPNNQTMNLEGFTIDTPESEFRRVVRHEAGHTLGFPHEHMRKELVERIDVEKAVAYFKKHSDWNRQTTMEQVLTPIESGSIRATAYADPNSIMCYQVPASITTDGKEIPGGLDLTALDAKFAALVYPVVK